jgi:hypothetical protein
MDREERVSEYARNYASVRALAEVLVELEDAYERLKAEVQSSAQSRATAIVADVLESRKGDMAAANHVARERFKMAREVREALAPIETLIRAADDHGLASAPDDARESVERIKKACDRLTLLGLEAYRDAGIEPIAAGGWRIK